MKPTLILAILLAIADVRARAQEKPELWRLIESVLANSEFASSGQVVLDHLAGVPDQRSGVRNRLSCVDTALREPWAPPRQARELRDALAAPAAPRLGFDTGELWQSIGGWLDLGDLATAEDDQAIAMLDAHWVYIAGPELRGEELLVGLSDYLANAHAILAEATDGLDERASELLFGQHREFCSTWHKRHFPSSAEDMQPTKVEVAAMQSFLDILCARPLTDRRRVLAVACALARLAEPEFLRGLPGRLRGIPRAKEIPEGFAGDIVTVIGDEPSSRVVLGGTKSTRYDAAAALVIDLGGNDTYRRAAVVDSADRLASVVIDLKGNDRYESDGPGPAYAAAGVAILVDVRGHDEYVSGRLGQAASALGVALLVDVWGDDHYEMHDFGQGHSLCGVALLYDLQGDDRYSAWAFAQGGGIGYGLCALVDGEGNDEYVADEHWPDVYGDSGPGVHHGASQGYSTGVRSALPGGIAALLDLGDGRDRYQAGSFSQGGGYYFAFGLMFDGGGDDENHTARYGQGFGVHQGVGVRWDAGGDDSYSCRSVAHCGMAWDEGVGYFLDDAGDDTYSCGDVSIGCGAQTGVAVFLDGGGKDRFAAGNQSLGASGSSEYHDKPSIGVMIDLGGGRDSYDRKTRGDDTVRVDPDVGILVDTRARSLARAVREVERRK